jgi:hypothetical protein
MIYESALPYLDPEKLSYECAQIIEKHFRSLRQTFLCAHSRAIVSHSEEQFQLYFPDSRTTVAAMATPEAVAFAILEQYAVFNLRILLWGKLPATQFLKLVEAIRSCGFVVLRCHEDHAILQLPKENYEQTTRLRVQGPAREEKPPARVAA